MGKRRKGRIEKGMGAHSRRGLRKPQGGPWVDGGIDWRECAGALCEGRGGQASLSSVSGLFRSPTKRTKRTRETR